MLPTSLLLPFPPVHISTFYSCLLLFCSTIHPHPHPPASSSSSFLSSSALCAPGSSLRGLAPRASGICAVPLHRRGEAVQEMRPPLAPGRGSLCLLFSRS